MQLRNKPVRITERSSVNQCINELSNLAAEAARRRCNSEIVQRTDINQDTNGKYAPIIKYNTKYFFRTASVTKIFFNNTCKNFPALWVYISKQCHIHIHSDPEQEYRL